ncbi:MAG: trypsin-like peptidase domain-containing protein [Porphyromonadaceae bacterium]|nr:trypsin-like peptidase domain-containing protein [Porphyromonadaceae bacterium]
MTRLLHQTVRYLLGISLILSAWEGGQAQFRIPQSPRAEVSTFRSLSLSTARTKREALRSPSVLTIAPPTAEELRSIQHSEEGLRTYIFAVERPVKQATSSLGEFAQDGEGNYVWRAILRAPRAKSIGLRLGKYALPEGAALFIQPLGTPATGALTAAHNTPDSLLQIAPIASEEVELLYEFPIGTARSSLTLPFTLEATFYGFRELSGARQSPAFAKPGEPFYDHPRASLEALSCAPNVIAHPESWKQARSVVLLIVGGTSASSGALINNTRQDGTPYVLTSAHCLNNLFLNLGNLPTVRRNAATTVFFFGFQSPLKEGNIRATEEQSLSGASLIGYSEDSEMCLLRIEGLPTDASGKRAIPTAYQPYFAGWNRRTSPVGPFVGIHHPGGSTKRYNRSEDTSTKTDDYLLNYINTAGQTATVAWRNKHWEIQAWETGMTAAGSSGSPLFDKDGLIIGALTGGASSCASPYDDHYWSLKGAWSPERTGLGSLTYLSPWLDPTKTGAETCPGLDPYAGRTIQRLSPIYPDPNVLSSEAIQPNRITTPLSTSDGVGNRLGLPALHGVKVLGAYIVFKSDGNLQAKDIPQLRVRLQRFAQREEAGTAILDFSSSTLGQFSRFGSTGSKELAARTLRSDTIELFFPAPANTVLDLEEGQYLLSCQTTNGRSLPLPLVGYEGTARRAQGWTGWVHEVASGWKRSDDLPQGAYWVDLLVDTPSPITSLENAGGLLPEALTAYYHAGELHLAGDQLFDNSFSLRVYDLTGQRHLEDTFPQSVSGHSSLRLRLPAGQYIATIAPSSIAKPDRSQRISITFVHR